MVYRSRVMELGGCLYVEVPPQVREQLNIDAKSKVGIKMYDRKTFMVEVNLTSGPQKEKCENCLQREGGFTCQLCNKWVCTTCFWEMGGICRACMGKK